MKYPHLYDPTVMSDKPVDDTTIRLANTFVNGFNIKLSDGPPTYLTTKIQTIKWLKTGKALPKDNIIFLETNISELPDQYPLLVFWYSTWVYELGDFNSYCMGQGTRYDEIMVLDGSDLASICRSDNPQWCHADYCMIKDTSGTFAEIGLPEEGYEQFVEYMLSEQEPSELFDYEVGIDEDIFKEAHPMIRKCLEKAYKTYKSDNA